MRIWELEAVARKILCDEKASEALADAAKIVVYALENTGLLHIVDDNITVPGEKVTEILGYVKDEAQRRGYDGIDVMLMDEPVSLVAEYLAMRYSGLFNRTIDVIYDKLRSEGYDEPADFLLSNKHLLYDTVAYALIHYMETMGWPLILMYGTLFNIVCEKTGCYKVQELLYVDRQPCADEKAEKNRPYILVSCRTAGGKTICCLQAYTYKPEIWLGKDFAGEVERFSACFIADEYIGLPHGYLDQSPIIQFRVRGHVYAEL